MTGGQHAVSSSTENGSHTMWIKEKTKKNVQDFEVKCNGVFIKSESTVKYLGINIDSDMSGES